jgi:hypothetical protein
VNFTREPIILSVIAPKDGFKLVLRNTSGEGQEDFFVDAVEIVSFNNAIFFRSLERPKSFLLPTAFYEVLEVKETRMVLKNAVQEKPIKIGGGLKEDEQKTTDKLKDKRKNRRRKPSPEALPKNEQNKQVQGGDAPDEPHVSSSVLKKLFPPPNTLIKEKLTRFKNEEFFEENILPLAKETKEENVSDDKKKESVSEDKTQEKPQDDKKVNEATSENNKGEQPLKTEPTPENKQENPVEEKSKEDFSKEKEDIKTTDHVEKKDEE